MLHQAELETAKGLIAQAIYKKCFVDVAINDVLMPLRRKGSANLQIHVDGLPLQTICLQWDPVLCEALQKYFNFQEVKTSYPTAKLDRLSDNDREAVEWAARTLTAGGSIDLRVRHSHPSLTSYVTGGILRPDDQYRILGRSFKDLTPTELREALAAGGGWKSRAVFLQRLYVAYQRTL